MNPDVRALVDGEAEAILYGGCLSILVASLGTPYEIKTKGTILFLEDLATKPYQIDRMLMQLALAVISITCAASSSEKCLTAYRRLVRATRCQK